MDIKDLVKSAKNSSTSDFNKKLSNLMRNKSKYANMDAKNRKTLSDLIKKHSDRIKDGRGLSSDTLRRESYDLYRKKDKMGLTQNDVDDIKEVLGAFKK
jgi:hypothetical protein